MDVISGEQLNLLAVHLLLGKYEQLGLYLIMDMLLVFRSSARDQSHSKYPFLMVIELARLERCLCYQRMS